MGLPIRPSTDDSSDEDGDVRPHFPPGAMGMPVRPAADAGTGGTHFPPGAMGLPVRPTTDDGDDEADAGAGGTHFPPGALGLPVRPAAGAGTGGTDFPPGALGLPVRPAADAGTGRPPGAVGLPVRPPTEDDCIPTPAPHFPPGAMGLPRRPITERFQTLVFSDSGRQTFRAEIVLEDDTIVPVEGKFTFRRTKVAGSAGNDPCTPGGDRCTVTLTADDAPDEVQAVLGTYDVVRSARLLGSRPTLKLSRGNLCEGRVILNAASCGSVKTVDVCDSDIVECVPHYGPSWCSGGRCSRDLRFKYCTSAE